MFKYKLNYGDDLNEEIESVIELKEGDEFNYKGDLFFVTDRSRNCHKANLDYLFSSKKLKYYFEQHGYKWSDDFLEEKKLQQLFLERLSIHFDIETEVSGIHQSGGTVRIDAVLKSSHNHIFFSKHNFPLPKHIGIEFKNPMNIGKSTGRNYYDVFAQCVDYSQTNFKDYGNLIVLSCPLFRTPALSSLILYLKEFNVGYITISGNSIVFKWGEMTIWQEGVGFTEAAFKNKFITKIGTRSK